MELDEQIELLPIFCDMCELDFDKDVITLGEVKLARFLVRFKVHPACDMHTADYFYCAVHWGRAIRREYHCVVCKLPLTVSEEDPL